MASCHSSYSLVRPLSNRTGCLLKSSIMSPECQMVEVPLLCAKFDSSTSCTFSCSSVTQRLTIASCSFPEFDTRCSGSLFTLRSSRLVDLLIIECRSIQRTKFHQIFYFYYTHMPHIGRQLSCRCYFMP